MYGFVSFHMEPKLEVLTVPEKSKSQFSRGPRFNPLVATVIHAMMEPIITLKGAEV